MTMAQKELHKRENKLARYKDNLKKVRATKINLFKIQEEDELKIR